MAPIVLLACGGDRPAEQAPPPAEERVSKNAPPAAPPVRKPAAKPAQTSTPTPTPAPPPPPKPEPVVQTVPVGTELIVELVDGASSQTSQVGGAASLGLRFDSLDPRGGRKTAIAAGTKGQEVALPVGTTLALQIEQPLTISVQP